MITTLFATLKFDSNSIVRLHVHIPSKLIKMNFSLFAGIEQSDKCQLVPLQWIGAQENRRRCPNCWQERIRRRLEDQEESSTYSLTGRLTIYIFSCIKMMQLLTESQMMTTFTTHFYWFQFKTTHFHFILVQCVDLMKFFSSIICRTNQQRTSTKSFSSKELAAHWANFVIRLCTATTVTILNR